MCGGGGGGGAKHSVATPVIRTASYDVHVQRLRVRRPHGCSCTCSPPTAAPFPLHDVVPLKGFRMPC